jgi:fructosamine-3-kinase
MTTTSTRVGPSCRALSSRSPRTPPIVSDTSFTKSSRGSPDGFYAVEAAGLAWLRAAGAGSAEVVGVQRVQRDSIVLDRLESARPTRAAAADFGRALWITHAAGASSFGVGPDGWSGDGFIGRQTLTLRPVPTWGGFYAEQRLRPYALEARRLAQLSREGLTAVERVCDRLTSGEWDDDRPPARLHGDLWSGNVLYTRTGVVLIDPAAHGGHGLTDLAMLHLFGAPHLSTITAAYAEAAELPTGWPELIGLHQLHPLLVHAASHGAAYGDEAARTAARYR